MAEAKIDLLGMADLELVAELYNQVFAPARDAAFFKRRFLGRYNELIMVAHVDDRPVGFTTGFELKPSVFFSWLYGVLPDYRRAGVGSQMMTAVQAWAQEHGYESIRLECQNSHRAMLHMCIEHEYHIHGVRWDPDLGVNLVIFEKTLND
ncbi:GNAT family N-acetyltransferase [Planctomycetales bacterium ZRK34]|nr:GNAT family N-acetyltransferase [Planctomycetales bacterium ZRK34]